MWTKFVIDAISCYKEHLYIIKGHVNGSRLCEIFEDLPCNFYRNKEAKVVCLNIKQKSQFSGQRFILAVLPGLTFWLVPKSKNLVV